MPDDDAELAKLHQELFPTEEAYAAWQHDSLRSVTPPPAGTQERQQYDDLMQLYADKDRPMAENSRRGVCAPEPDTRNADLTAEQKAGMDKALAGANVNEARMIPPPESAPAAPCARRAAGPQGRRARAAEPQSRRAAEPQSRRAAEPQSRRAAEPQSRREVSPRWGPTCKEQASRWTWTKVELARSTNIG